MPGLAAATLPEGAAQVSGGPASAICDASATDSSETGDTAEGILGNLSPFASSELNVNPGRTGRDARVSAKSARVIVEVVNLKGKCCIFQMDALEKCRVPPAVVHPNGLL